MSTAIGVSLPRLATAVGKAVSEYAVLGKTPGFTADFIKNKYPSHSSFASAITHSRSGNAVMTDGYGPELVANGGFDSDASGWTNDRDAVLTVTDGKLNIANSTNTYSGIIQEITLKSGGGTYDVELDYTKINSNARIAVGTTSGGNDLADTSSIFSSGKQSVRFTTTTETVYVRIYVNSPTSGDSITIDNVSVREMPVLKWAPHNLLSYSEDFSNSAWSKTSVGVLTDNSVAPDGFSTADKITANNAVSSHNVKSANVGSASGQGLTLGVYAKAGEYSYIALYDGVVSEGKYFDLSSGTILGNLINAPDDARITDVGDGWYFCEIDTTAGGNTGLSIYLSDTGSRFSFQGDGSSGVYLWGAHVYRSDLGGMAGNPDQPPSRASYVPTTSSAKYLPRIGHHVYNGSAWVNEGLLAESEARTNLATDSDMSSYSVISGGTRQANHAISPDGTQSAFKLESNATGSNHIGYNGLIVSGQSYAVSIYAKAGNNDIIRIGNQSSSNSGQWFDLTNGTLLTSRGSNNTATIQDVGNGWYRCTRYFDSAVVGSPEIFVGNCDADNSTNSINGSYVYLYGFQIENNATSSSFIPTSGSSVTRAAETFTIPSANLPWPSPSYIGSELITNGTFDTDSDWTKGTGWTISGGKAVGSSAATLSQSASTISGNTYLFKFTVSNYSAGTITPNISGRSGPSFTGNGTFETAIVAAGGAAFNLLGGGNFTGDIDSVSVREINPLSVSIAMDGRVTYADDGTTQTSKFYRWRSLSGEYIQPSIFTDSTRTGLMAFEQTALGVYDAVSSSITHYSPDVFVPFDVASRHGSTFLNGAVEGVALTENTTPTALPDLSATDLKLAFDYMGTIGTFRVWDKDLGDTGIVEATNPSLEPSLSLTFEGTGTNSFVVNDWSE